MEDKSKKHDGEAAEEASEHGAENKGAASEPDELRQQLEKKESEARENYDRFLRQVAELENFKKRKARRSVTPTRT